MRFIRCIIFGRLWFLIVTLTGAAQVLGLLFLFRGAFLLGLFTAYQSWETLIVAMFAAFLLGGLVSAILLVFRIRSRKDSIPFGPYLVAGAYLAIVWAGTIASWYLDTAA